MHCRNEFRGILAEPDPQPIAVAKPEPVEACARPPSATLQNAAGHQDSAETEAEQFLVTFLRAFAAWHT